MHWALSLGYLTMKRSILVVAIFILAGCTSVSVKNLTFRRPAQDMETSSSKSSLIAISSHYVNDVESYLRIHDFYPAREREDFAKKLKKECRITSSWQRNDNSHAEPYYTVVRVCYSDAGFRVQIADYMRTTLSESTIQLEDELYDLLRKLEPDMIVTTE